MAGVHGPRSNYADKPTAADHQGALCEHRLVFGSDFRAYTPTAGESDDPNAGHGRLAVDSSGDHFWRPPSRSRTALRYAADPGNSTREALEAQMPTLNPRAFAIGTTTHYRQAPQGGPRPTTRFTPDQRIAQVYIAPEKQARQTKTGDEPHQAPVMKRIWDFIDNKKAAA